MNLTEYNITNNSNYYKHDGTKGIAVQKVRIWCFHCVIFLNQSCYKDKLYF